MSTEPVISSSLLVWNQVKQAFLRTEKAQLLARGSVATVVLRACSLGLKMLVGILFARMLSAKGYGVYAYAVAWLATLMIPTTLGLDHVLLRYVSAYKETRSWSALKGLLQFATQRAVAAAVVVSLFSIAIVAMLSGKDWDFRVTMWITLALLPIVVILQLQQASLRGLDHPVLARLPENIVYPVLLLTFAAGAYFIVGTTLTVPQAALANGTAWVAAFVLGTLFVLFKLPEPVRTSGRTYEKSAWMAMIPPLIFSGSAYHILSRGDVLILGVLGTSRDVGIYVVAARGAELILFMYDAVTIAGASLFSSIYATGDMKELQRFASLVAKTILWVTLPVYVLFLAITPWFLGFFGPEFVQGTAVMRLLTTFYFLSSLGGFVIIMLYMTGHQRDVAIVMGTMTGVNIGLCFLLIPWLGIMGAGIAAGISLLLMHGTLVLVLYKRVGIVSLPFSLKKKGESWAH